MREIITYTYIADDGTEFDNKEECLAYEMECKKRFQQVKDYVLSFNECGQIMSFNNESDFMEIYNEMIYLIIIADITPDSIQFIEDCGYCKIPTEKGIYHYNSMSFEWEDYSIWNPIKEYIKEYS